MLTMDKVFLKELGLDNFNASIPMVNPDVAIASIEADSSREGKDLYETSKVQTIADQLYGFLGRKHSDRFTLVPQFQEEKRLSPGEIAQTIFNLSGQPVPASASGQGRLVGLEYNPDQIDYAKLETLLTQLSTRKLEKINPYYPPPKSR